MSKLSETFEVGGLTVAALSDGAAERALGGFFHGVEPAEWTRALGLTSPEQAVPFNFGAFLVRGDGYTTLIDSGYGAVARTMGMEGGGELLDRIRELGVELEEVDRVVHTHLHLDHCGWNVDEEHGDALTFPNATVFVSRAELDYWTGEASEGNQMRSGTRSRIDPIIAAGRVETFIGEYALSDAITMVPTPGHTPGHCAAMLASGGEHLLVVGDAAHHPIHLERHDWVPGIDLDRAESERSRAKLAALAVERDALVTGPHFPILTFGRVRRVESGYKWEQVRGVS